jgi:hypothetical protein
MAKKPAPKAPPKDMPKPEPVRPKLAKPVNVEAIRASVYHAMDVSTDPRVRLMHGLAVQQGAFRRLLEASQDLTAWLDDCEASRGEFMSRVFS